jgi:UDP-glucose 4-epimerase
VYGNPHTVPIQEHFPLSATNPYGASKLMVENILRDLQQANPAWRVALLRYFNPTGAHESGLIGEDPKGIPNNLMPYIAQVAAGQRSHLQIFGGDYDTPDGTGVRDYIHVIDLVRGHIKALQYLQCNDGLVTVNLGTGTGYSVLDMLQAMEQAAEKTIPYKVVDRRAGDIATCYADPCYALELLGWRAELNQQAMCRDMWNWQSKNPNGYDA